MSTLVLCDLEQTLIESWSMPDLLHHRASKVRDFLQENTDAQMGLMSWAVYDDIVDLEHFRQQLAPALEEFLGRAFAPRWTLSMDGWGAELARHTHKHLPREEMFDIFGKDEVFFKLARVHPEWRGREVVLFDDAFPTCTMQVPGRTTTARLINVIDRVQA